MTKVPKKAIVTISIGEEAQIMAEFTIPAIKAYANRVGADFICIENRTLNTTLPAMYQKMQIQKLLGIYDRILYVDIDVIVTPWSKDIFSEVPGNGFCVVSVENIFKGAQNEKDSLNVALGKIQWKIPYFNSGVMLIGQQHNSVFNTTDGLISLWEDWKKNSDSSGLNDQSILNYRVNSRNVKVSYIDRTFNFTRAGGDFHKRFENSFIHYAGLKGRRDRMIEADLSIMKSPIKIKLLQLFPMFSKLRDYWLFK